MIKKDHIIANLDGLRKGDPYYLVYPFENSSPTLFKHEINYGFNYSEYLLDLKDEEYTVEIALKGETTDKITIQKKEVFKMKPPFATSFTTTKEVEIDALNMHIKQLQKDLRIKEQNIQEITKQDKTKDDEITQLRGAISEKNKKIQQLDVQKTNLEKESLQKDQQIKRLREQQTELMKKYQFLKNPPKKEHRVK